MKKDEELLYGVIIFIVLAVLTGAEYWMAVATRLWAALSAIALLKASLVLQYYMHISRVTSGDGGH